MFERKPPLFQRPWVSLFFRNLYVEGLLPRCVPFLLGKVVLWLICYLSLCFCESLSFFMTFPCIWEGICAKMISESDRCLWCV